MTEDNYFKKIGTYRLLNKKEEIELGRKIKDEKDMKSRNELIESNLRLFYC